MGLGLPLRDVRLMSYSELKMFIRADKERCQAASKATEASEEPKARKATQADIDRLMG